LFADYSFKNDQFAAHLKAGFSPHYLSISAKVVEVSEKRFEVPRVLVKTYLKWGKRFFGSMLIVRTIQNIIVIKNISLSLSCLIH
jgi:hypothetical protein